MNRDMLAEKLWASVIDGADDTPVPGDSCPVSEDAGWSVDDVLSRGSMDSVLLREMLREVRRSALFHALVALDSDPLLDASELVDERSPEEGEIVLRYAGGDPWLGDRLESLARATRRFALGCLAVLMRGVDREEIGGLHEAFGAPPVRASGARPFALRADGPLLTVGRSYHLVFSPEGDRVVSAFGVVTEIGSGKEVARCDFFSDTSWVAVSPDGRLVAATNTAGRIAVCDLDSGRRLQVLRAAGEGPGAAFSLDGSRLEAWTHRGARAWIVGSWEPSEPLGAPSRDAAALDLRSFGAPSLVSQMRVCWAPDGERFAWATLAGFEVRSRQGELVATRSLRNATLGSFSRDGRLVAFASLGRGEVWELSTLVRLQGPEISQRLDDLRGPVANWSIELSSRKAK